jgi:hypothetical protein
VEVHVGKIAAARTVCETLYAGFEKHKITVDVEEVAEAAVDEDPQIVAAV